VSLAREGLDGERSERGKGVEKRGKAGTSRMLVIILVKRASKTYKRRSESPRTIRRKGLTKGFQRRKWPTEGR